jgi:hypothetical protein
MGQKYKLHYNPKNGLEGIKWHASNASSLSALCKEYLTSRLQVGMETQQQK